MHSWMKRRIREGRARRKRNVSRGNGGGRVGAENNAYRGKEKWKSWKGEKGATWEGRKEREGGREDL